MRGLAATPTSGAMLVERVRDAAGLARELDLVLARLARELEAVSDEVPGGGLARAHGQRNAADLLATVMGATRAEALRLIGIGRALQEGEDQPDEPEPDEPDETEGPEPDDGPEPDEPEGPEPDGGPGPDDDDDPPPPPPPVPPLPRPAPPRFPHVTAALNAGRISADSAHLIMAMLDSLPDTVPLERRREAERDLVERAPGMSASTFGAVVRRFKASLDVDEHQRTVARMRAARSLTMSEDKHGMLTLHGEFDPETGAPLKAALEGLVSESMRRSREHPGEDTRTIVQMRADALSALARHGLSCEATDLPLASVTVVVRVAEKDLHAGLGLGEVDGCSIPLDIAGVRRLGANAHIIPAILAGPSEILDWGRGKRLFTKAQRLAILERDGGCAFCGAPPAWCEVHHIRWWSRDLGTTDIANGCTLCSNCHHIIHEQGWTIEATTTEIWFIPPASIDPTRTPRRGGRARYYPPPAP